jgi:hypothetical protein
MVKPGIVLLIITLCVPGCGAQNSRINVDDLDKRVAQRVVLNNVVVPKPEPEPEPEPTLAPRGVPEVAEEEGPKAPRVMYAQTNHFGHIPAAKDHRVIILTAPSWCVPCQKARVCLEALRALGHGWKIGPGPENHFQVLDIDTNGGKEQAIKWKAKYIKYLENNGLDTGKARYIPQWIEVDNGEVVGGRTGWFPETRDPSSTESMWAVVGILGVTRELQSKAELVQEEIRAIPEERLQTKAEWDFITTSRGATLNMVELFQNWAPGGKRKLSNNAVLNVPSNLKFKARRKGGDTYLDVTQGSLSLDYNRGIFSGSLSVPYIRFDDRLGTLYIGVKGPMPDYPVTLKWSE